MATIISGKGATTLNTANGFYRVEAANIGCFSTTVLALTTTRTIAVTFANAGDCQGIVLCVTATTVSTRNLVVRLQEDVASVWTTRAETIMTPSEIAGTYVTTSINRFLGTYFLPVEFAAPYAVDTTASKWRFEISHGTGTGSWSLRTSNGTAAFYATWCDNELSFTDDDVLIVKDKVTIDKSASIGALLGTGDTVYGVGAVICRNLNQTSADVALLEWENPAAAAYTFTIGGMIALGSYSGFRVGTSTSRIPFDKKATLEWLANAVAGTTRPIFIFPNGISVASTIGGRSALFFYGETEAFPKTNLSADAAIAQKEINVQDDVDWKNGDRLYIGKNDVRGQGVTTVPNNTIDYVEGKVTGVTIHTAGTNYEVDDELTINTGGVDATLKVETIGAGGEILTVSIVAAGTGYIVANEFALTGGAGADAKINITTVSGKKIVLNENILTRVRKGPTDGDALGGTVIKENTHSILLNITGAGLGTTHNVTSPFFFEMSGVDLHGQGFNLSYGTTHYFFMTGLIDSNKHGQWLVEDVTAISDFISGLGRIRPLVPPKGMLVQRCYSFRTSPITSALSYIHRLSGFKSGRLTIKDSVCLNWYGTTTSQISTSTSINLTLDNYRNENARALADVEQITYIGITSIFRNNYAWGSANTGVSSAAISVRQLISPLEISGNSIENCVCGMIFLSVPIVGAKDNSTKFNSNTTDITLLPSSNPTYVFQTPDTASLVIDTTNIPEMVYGSRIGFSDLDKVANNDWSLFPEGRMRRTGPDLADTTVRTAGGFAIRFNPEGDILRWEFDVPTGDIKNKTMVISLWCKINAAAYYEATTYNLPKLLVYYDGFTEACAEATETTDWQLLTVPITPLTSTGAIHIDISAFSEAVDADGYVYFDDMSILYPAGYQLNLGGLDLWQDAMPITPPISTNLSALDVWAADPTVFGAGTIGKKVNDIKNDTGLIGALL